MTQVTKTKEYTRALNTIKKLLTTLVLNQLAKEFRIEKTFLYRTRTFYLDYKYGLTENAKHLAWSEHVSLLPLRDKNLREFYLPSPQTRLKKKIGGCEFTVSLFPRFEWKALNFFEGLNSTRCLAKPRNGAGEYPRRGLIRMEAMDKTLVNLRKSMN